MFLFLDLTVAFDLSLVFDRAGACMQHAVADPLTSR